MARFTVSVVSGYDVLVNEDKSRSFVCLRVRGGRHLVLQLIRKSDTIMDRFKQPCYYEVCNHNRHCPSPSPFVPMPNEHEKISPSLPVHGPLNPRPIPRRHKVPHDTNYASIHTAETG